MSWQVDAWWFESVKEPDRMRKVDFAIRPAYFPTEAEAKRYSAILRSGSGPLPRTAVDVQVSIRHLEP